MGDRDAIAYAAGAAAGAWIGIGAPVWVGGAAVVAALVVRRPWLLCVALLLLAGGRAESDRAGLARSPSGPMETWALLASDPVTAPSGAVNVELVVDGAHLDATARGEAAARLEARAAGDRVEVAGTISPLGPLAPGAPRRHVAGRLAVATVGRWSDRALPTRAANALRDALARSAAVLPARQRGLYLGLVLGDDRAEPADIADEFRGAGLAHLLAVSGQNVAFALAVAAPLLRRAPYRARFVLTVAVLALFVLATRAEPSVLRAAVMAGIAAWAAVLGREASGLRVLCLAVVVLLVADPFLVGSLGFQLSVAASASILRLSRPLARNLPGPRPVADAIAVSVAAQLGVAPILATAFDGVPVAGLLANVLAAPAAGPVMAWGIVAGIVGGALGPAVATVLHLPTGILIWWIAGVARWASHLPLGLLRLPELLALAVAGAVWAIGRSAGFVRSAALATVAAALLAPAVALRAGGAVRTDLGPGAVLWQRGAVVLVLDGRARADAVLRGLREAGAGPVDLVVERSASGGVGLVVDAVAAACGIGAVVTPADVPEPATRTVGGLVVALESGDGGLAVDVTLAR